MAKTLLIENLKTCLEYSNKTKNPHALGHLAGIGGDLRNPTRNGRLYEAKLWNNVMASEDFKEQMDAHMIFGENDHPSDRVEPMIDNASVTLTNMEVRENEGILWVEFDILPTEKGEILNALVEYGCKVGVSSRGLGDEIQRDDGVIVIDPDTYSYYGHDIVCQPAVKMARPEKVESVKRAKVTDVFNKAIENATTVAELNNLKRLAESVKIPNLDSIEESINNKLSNGSSEGNNISEQLENDLGKLAEENERLKIQIEKLKKANNISDKKSRHLSETYQSEVRVARQTLRRLEVGNDRLKRENRSLTEDLNQSESQLRKYENAIDKEIRNSNSLEKEIERLKAENHQLKIDSNKKDRELEEVRYQVNLLNHDLRKYESKIDELEGEISSKADELEELYDTNRELTEDLNSMKSSTRVTESKVQTVSNKLTEQGNHLNETLEKYIDAKCLSERVSKKQVKSALPLNYTSDDVDRVVEKISDENRRLNNMPMSLEPISAKLESYSGCYNDPEMDQTMRLLTGVFNQQV